MATTPLSNSDIMPAGVGSQHGSAAVVTTTAAPGHGGTGALGCALPSPGRTRGYRSRVVYGCRRGDASWSSDNFFANNSISIDHAGHAGRSTWSPLTFGVSDLPHSLDAGRFAAPRPRRTARTCLEEPFLALTLADPFKAASP